MLMLPPGYGASPSATTQGVPIPRLPVPPAGNGGGAAAPRAPVVRGLPPDDPLPPCPAPMSALPSLPSPAALGVAAALPAPVLGGADIDWTATRRQLKDLGVVSFQVNEVAQGGWRFVCQLRTARAEVLHRIEAGPAATEAEAVTLALAEAKRWAAP